MLKYQLNKLELKRPPEKCIPEVILKMGLYSLPIQSKHALFVAQLPAIHKDPFGRLLICQSKIEEMILLSPDSVFKKYQVQLLW